MELLKLYSDNTILEKLQRLLGLPQGREVSARRPPKQVQRRLPPEHVEDLIAEYKAGWSTDELAAAFSVSRSTVVNILNRHSVTLRIRGISDEDLPEVIRLYQDGWSLAWLAAQFDVGRETVRAALIRAGVARRPRRGDIPS